MTSRAGQALLDDPRLRRADIGRDALGEAVAAIEKEVRDDIRARLDGVMPSCGDCGAEVTYHAECDEGDGHLTLDLAGIIGAAISTSSATETQDGPPVVEESELDDQPEMLASDRFYATETQDGERPGLREAAERARAHVERMARMENDADWTLFLMAVERLIEHAEAATPTPDDRDREVERIAAGIQTATDAMVILYPVITALRTWRDARNTTKNRHAIADAENNVLTQLRYFEDRAEVIDAGLRASGGKT